MMAKIIEIKMGALSDPIYKQLREQGFPVKKKDFEIVEKMSYSITLLKIHSILSMTETKKAEKRLVKLIVKMVNQLIDEQKI